MSSLALLHVLFSARLGLSHAGQGMDILVQMEPLFSFPTVLAHLPGGCGMERGKANIETDRILGTPSSLPKDFKRSHTWKANHSKSML